MPDFCRWGIIYQKGYQITGPITGTITTKLKGASYYNGSLGNFGDGCGEIDGNVNRTFDVGDYVIPPQVNVVTGYMMSS